MRIALLNNCSFTLTQPLNPGGNQLHVSGYSDELHSSLGEEIPVFLTLITEGMPVVQCVMYEADDSTGTAVFYLERNDLSVAWGEVSWTGPAVPAGTKVELRVTAEMIKYATHMYDELANKNAIAIVERAAGTFDPTANNYVAMGSGAGNASRAVCIGPSTTVGNDGVSVGTYTKATGGEATAVGVSATADAAKTVAQGCYAQARAAEAVAIGAQALSYGLRAVALGPNSYAHKADGIAIGKSASSAEVESIAIGKSSNVSSTKAIGIGTSANAFGSKSIAIGDAAATSADNTIAVGINTMCSGTDGVAIGSEAKVYAPSGIAIGKSAQASSPDTIAIGVSTAANPPFTIAIGKGANPFTNCQADIRGLFCLPSAATDAAVEGSDLAARHRAVPCSAISSQVINLGVVAGAAQVELPTDVRFYIDRIDVIQTATSTATGTPKISIGTSSSDKASILAATDVTVNAQHARQSFTPATAAGVPSIYIDVPTKTTTGNKNIRVVFVGYLAA